MNETRVKIKDSNAFVFGDSHSASGKGWLKLDGFGDHYFSLNGRILDQDFKLSQIGKGQEVLVLHEGELPANDRKPEDIVEIRTIAGDVVWESQKERV